MALNKYKMGELIELVLDTNSELLYGPSDVKGMTITKEIIPTKADVSKTDLSKFFVVHPGEFIYNPRTHGKRIGFGYNDTSCNFIISWNNIAFKIKQEMNAFILADYLFLHFKRDEWDREACFQSWGSSTEVFSWDTLCEMEIELPSIDIQRKYVNIYKSMIKNQEQYERGLDDLKLTCDAYIDELKKTTTREIIGKYLSLKRIKNDNEKIKEVYGVSNQLKFIEASSTVDKNSLSKYKIVSYDDIAYVPTTHMKIWAIAISQNSNPFVVSPIYEVFGVNNKNKLLPQYLFIWLCREETTRYAYYHSWGSARENFVFEDLCSIKIPIPSIEIQQSIVNIYKVYNERKQICDKLKEQIKNICPILIKGAIKEAREV